MLGQVNNVTTARAWFDKVTAEGAKNSIYDTALLDTFRREGVTRSSDLTEAKLDSVAKKLGVSAEGLLSAMSGKCPFGGGMPKAQAKQQ